MNMYFWNPVFSFEIPGLAHILLLILPTLHQQWPPRWKTMCHTEVCWRKMWKIVHFLQWYDNQWLECSKSNHPKACKLPSDHQSGWAAHVPSEDHLISFLDADSSGKTQSLWLKIVIQMCKLNSLLLVVCVYNTTNA